MQRDAQDVDRRPGQLGGDAGHERGRAALDAYLYLMRGDDHGRAFLRVMRSADQSQAKQELYRGVISDSSRPVQVIWAADDPALALATYGEKARRAAGLDSLVRIPGRHFPQEDQAPLIASHIARLVSSRSQARP